MHSEAAFTPLSSHTIQTASRQEANGAGSKRQRRRRQASGIYLLLFSLLATAGVCAQSASSTNKPPEPRVYRSKVEPRWFDDGQKFWYRLDLSNDRKEFILVDADAGGREKAFDHPRAAEALGEKLDKQLDAERLPIETLRFADNGKSVRLKVENQVWALDLETYEVTEDKGELVDDKESSREDRRRGRPRRATSTKSPDEKREILVRGHNLFLRDIENGKERQLTFDGHPNHSYAQDVQRARYVEMRYDERENETPVPEVHWSPDSKKLVAMRMRPGMQRTVYMVESSPKDQLQPRLQSYPYLKPGDEIPTRKPHLFDVDSGREIPISDALFSNPWSISDLRWEEDSSRFTFLYNQRGHQALRIVAVASDTGAVAPIIDETSETFVHYSGKFFCDYLDATDEIIWMSERDGWNHLYLYDAKVGKVKNQITKGEWLVRGVDRVDREKRQVWFRAGGIRPEQDPYYIHYCRINFDGSGLTILTEGDGTHSIEFSPDRKFFIDTYSRVDLPPVTELRRSDDGRLVCKLEEADISELAASGWKAPERFVAKGRDGTTDIHGVIHWPRETDPKRKYPVLESIYAGPHDSFTPKAFRASYGQDKLTKLGFIVVQMDGMGTSNRSKKFHDVCWKNIADAGFPDRILWIKAAAAKYPQFDLNRVGLYGTSAGAQNALGGLLWHGDFYKAGVADCGCHDNRMDKIWWNEQWMGWPVGPHYDEQSNVTQAHRLQGKLLLMVGELDKNVDPASTMQVVDALIKADKEFEMLVMPGGGHGVARTPYGWKRIEDFFVRHLLNAPDSKSTGAVAATSN